MLVRTHFLACAFVVLASNAVGQSASPGADLDIIRQRFHDSLLQFPDSVRDRLREPPKNALATMNADGSWADQVYTDTDRDNWKCLQHLPRTFQMARAARLRETPPDESQRFLNAAVASLRYWLQADPHNTNWWHNEIGVPGQIGSTLILLADDAPPEMLARGIDVMRRSKWDKWTGQNLVWGCGIQVSRGCLDRSPEVVGQALRRIWEEITVVPDYADGIQPDFSFHQHGQLLYAGGYGEGFTVDTTRFLMLARDTTFAAPAEKLAILQSYILDGQQWMLRGRQWDYGVEGRELVRPGKNASGMEAPVSALATLNGPRQAEFAEFAARLRGDTAAKPLVGNRHCWCSDYMVHQRPDYFTSARMFSTRSFNTDGFINGENKKSHHLADGATYVFVHGREYQDIFPVWDWHRIPGATIEQNTALEPKAVKRKGKTAFVGGASDGMYGCATMDLESDALRAKKSWFYFDDQFVCLGADINCPTANTVFTSINQCLLNGLVKMSSDPGGSTTGDRTLTDTKWIWHDSVGYIFPRSTNVHLRSQPENGSWSLISAATSKPITKDVFSLWLDHGAKVSEGTYAYVVMPAADAAKTAAAADDSPIEILVNDRDVQAVRHRSLHLTEAVFRRGGSVVSGGLTIRVDRPCALLVKMEAGRARLVVANPVNEQASVRVDLVATAGEGSASVEVELPTGMAAGKSVVRDVALQ